MTAYTPDAITLKGIQARGFHGVLEAEKTLGQLFIADITLFTDLTVAGTSDDIEQTVNYAEVASMVEDKLSGEPSQLIETVALNIINSVLNRFPLIEAAQVTVYKPQAPLPALLANVSVTVARKRKTPASSENGIPPHEQAGPSE